MKKIKNRNVKGHDEQPNNQKNWWKQPIWDEKRTYNTSKTELVPSEKLKVMFYP